MKKQEQIDSRKRLTDYVFGRHAILSNKELDTLKQAIANTDKEAEELCTK